MVDLRTTYMGVEMKNPLIIGAGPTTHTPEICQKAAQAGWGGVVLKTNVADEVVDGSAGGPVWDFKVPHPFYKLLDRTGQRWQSRVIKTNPPRSRGGEKLGKIPQDWTFGSFFQTDPETGCIMTSIGLFFNGDDKYPYYVSKTKELVEGTDCKVIASIAALTEKGWEQQCRLINQSKADMVELNMGCWIIGAIHPQSGQFVKVGMGMYPEIVERWTRFCAERLEKPMGVKLPPHCPDPLASVQAAIRGGAKAVQYADAYPYFPPIPAIIIDPDTLQVGAMPGVPFTWGLYWGNETPYICGCMAHFRLNGVNIDLSGCGGVREPKAVLRLLMAGASSVQTCTVTCVEGVDVGTEWLDDITWWMEEHGYNSIGDIQGIVANRKKLTPDASRFVPADIPQIMGGPLPSVRVALDEKGCINCGWCKQCCLHLAITMQNGRPVIDQKQCEVCGMCVAVCPTQVLSIVPRNGGGS